MGCTSRVINFLFSFRFLRKLIKAFLYFTSNLNTHVLGFKQANCTGGFLDFLKNVAQVIDIPSGIELIVNLLSDSITYNNKNELLYFLHRRPPPQNPNLLALPPNLSPGLHHANISQPDPQNPKLRIQTANPLSCLPHQPPCP